MTCWQAHLTGQINTDNLFADSTMLSQRWSTTKRWFPCRKALTLVLKWNACRNLLCVILSGFSNPQRLATPCVGNIEESCSCKMASCDVWIIWMMHWWGWWKETRIIQVAELWSAVISTYLQLFFVFLLLSFFFFFLASNAPILLLPTASFPQVQFLTTHSHLGSEISCPYFLDRASQKMLRPRI